MEPVQTDPFARFQNLFERASATEPFAGARAALATVSDSGEPSVRFVLVKGHADSGFEFFTNYGSPKAQDLEATGVAALAWHWDSIGVQVRARGTVRRVSAGRSDAYFASRPRGSQIGAWASEQSSPIASRESLEARYHAFEKRFEGADVPRPPHWGGYLLAPSRVEFWKEGDYRLHDRELYERAGAMWRVTRLAP
ncbi:MAG: pyridoxamine 5'-phosphate oxidase [Polyangiales bacterium]|nr:pyridoxamine 5'-phosphate oxidase [Myxococcales bacterium]